MTDSEDKSFQLLADFATYQEAKSWFDYYYYYYPYYGDVTKLDGDGDGRPCVSLPGGP